MKTSIAAFALAISISAGAAEPDQRLCELYGSLAQGVTQDRDRGVSYQAELGKLKGAAKGLPSRDGIVQISKAALQTAYLDMPKLTPEGAFKFFYAACMTAK